MSKPVYKVVLNFGFYIACDLKSRHICLSDFTNGFWVDANDQLCFDNMSTAKIYYPPSQIKYIEKL